MAAAGPMKGSPFEPEEETAIGNANAYANAKEPVRDEPNPPLAKQFNARLSGGEDAVATSKAATSRPSAAKPAPSAPAPSPRAAATPSAKGFVASPAPAANKPKPAAPHPPKQKKSQDEDEYDFGI
jgi:hypothetical protein